MQSSIPLSYYTDGRDIPDDIHVMTARRLMGMIFNESSLRMAKSASPEILAERLQAFEANWKNTPGLQALQNVQHPVGCNTVGKRHAGYTYMAEPNGNR